MTTKNTNLDRTRPFATVYGQPGALYEQDGVFFNAAGQAVEESTLIPCNDAPEPTPEETNEPLVLTVATDSGIRRDDGPDLSKKHWKHLKVMVEAYGGEWTTTGDAINFLKGRAS